MNLVEFQELSKRTMPFGGEPANQIEFENMLGNYAMGLVGEWCEYSLTKEGTEEEIKEVGDVLHYCVGLLSCLGEKIDIEKLADVDLDNSSITEKMMNILEIPKKHIYHRHELDKEKLISVIYDAIQIFVVSFEHLLSEILQTNIDKLRTRYPEKFNPDDSIKRVDVKQG